MSQIMSYFWMSLLVVQVAGSLYRCPHDLLRNHYLKTYRDKCYKFELRETNWETALGWCHKDGGTLVHIMDSSTQNWIMSSLNTLDWLYNGIWIGLRDYPKSNTWTWTNGKSDDKYHNWDTAKGEPSCHSACYETCAVIRKDEGGKWHDKRCHGFFSTSYSSICMYDMAPIPTTTRKTTTSTTKPTTTSTTTTPTTTTSTTTTPTTPTTRKTTRLRTVSTTQKSTRWPTSTTEKPPPKITDQESTRQPPSTSDFVPYVNGPSGLQSSETKSVKQELVIGAVMGVLGTLLTVIIIILAVCYIKRRKKRNGDQATGFGNPVYSSAHRNPVVVLTRDNNQLPALENANNERLENADENNTLPPLPADYLHVKHVELLNEKFDGDTDTDYAKCSDFDGYDDSPEKIYQEIEDFQVKLPAKDSCDDSCDDSCEGADGGVGNSDSHDDERVDNVYVDMGTSTGGISNQTYTGCISVSDA